MKNRVDKTMKVSAKIISFLVTLVIVVSILTGCATNQKVNIKPSETISYKILNKEISGKWQVVDSNARFKIFFVDGDIHIKGWDRSDGEKFKISNVEWDGKRLKGTFVMPSTGQTRHSELLLIDRDILKGIYKGNVSGEEIWLRE